MKRAIGVIAAACALLCGMRWLLGDSILAQEEKRMRALLQTDAPFSQESTDGHALVSRAWRCTDGYIVETTPQGYVAPVVLWVGVREGGTVAGVTICDMAETRGLGARARSANFLAQFTGTNGNASIDAISGATVTSRAVASGVNAAVAYATGADAVSFATQWG